MELSNNNLQQQPTNQPTIDKTIFYDHFKMEMMETAMDLFVDGVFTLKFDSMN